MPFSIVNKGEGWFWCSLLEVRVNALIGPFPSQETPGRHSGSRKARAEEAKLRFTAPLSMGTQLPPNRARTRPPVQVSCDDIPCRR
jgi:hypothetical protein